MAHDTLPLFMVGHSFGGHAFGLLPNHDRVARFHTFATGAGWHGWMPLAEQIKVTLMWRVIGPLLTRWKGYLAWSKLGMGEDLPLGVYRDWKHWCRFPRYFFDDPAMPHLADRFGRVTTPIRAANALDDLWAPPASRDAFMAGYRSAPVESIDIDPRHSGLGAIATWATSAARPSRCGPKCCSGLPNTGPPVPLPARRAHESVFIP
jgi:predicted alpha/beta hydrolase